MKRLLLSAVALLALSGAASADIVLENKLSGTGDNVVFNSITADTALATLNGQHNEVVRFQDLEFERVVLDLVLPEVPDLRQRERRHQQ